MNLKERLKKINEMEPGTPAAHFMGKAWCSNEYADSMGFMVSITEKAAEWLQETASLLHNDFYELGLRGINLRIPRGMDLDTFDADQVGTLDGIESSEFLDASAGDSEMIPREFPAKDRGLIGVTLSPHGTATFTLYSKYSSDYYELDLDVAELLQRTRAQLGQAVEPRM